MSTIHILYKNFLDPQNYELTVGGVQTYICSLLNLIKRMEKVAIVYQFSDRDFEQEYAGIKVVGVNVKTERREEKQKEKLFKACMQRFNMEADILLFASELMIVKNDVKRSLAIQHGIYWDDQELYDSNDFLNKLHIFKNAIRAYRRISRIHQVSRLVCVDYNFVNWYRTQVTYNRLPLVVIPNSAIINSNVDKTDNTIRIIFARRFVKIRGTRIFAKAINRILEKYQNVEVTIAGEGPEYDYFNEMFSNNVKVTITKYNPEESAIIHAKHDIAVIPSIGSEGTSLSLLEAMASKCAVIATNVGGMTNIILDNYNGLLISPDEKQLYDAIEKLIINKGLREKLAENAYNTVAQAFNRNLWEERWKKVLNDTIDGK